MIEEYNWVERYFPVAARYESVIVENDNVLTPKALNAVGLVLNEPSREKTNNVVSEQVRHKSDCTVT